MNRTDLVCDAARNARGLEGLILALLEAPDEVTDAQLIALHTLADHIACELEQAAERPAFKMAS